MKKRIALSALAVLVLGTGIAYAAGVRVHWHAQVFNVVVEGMRQSPSGAQDAQSILEAVPGVLEVRVDPELGTVKT